MTPDRNPLSTSWVAAGPARTSALSESGARPDGRCGQSVRTSPAFGRCRIEEMAQNQPPVVRDRQTRLVARLGLGRGRRTAAAAVPGGPVVRRR